MPPRRQQQPRASEILPGVVGKDPKFSDPAKGNFGVGAERPDRGAHALAAKG
jgi:hypothetical protein